MSKLSTWWRGIVNAIKFAFTWTCQKPEQKPEPKPEPKPEAEVEVEQKCTCDLSKPLCDPEPDRFTYDYMAANAEREECGQEHSEGIVVRFRVWVPRRNTWWILSSVGKGQVRKGASGLDCPCFVKNGYSYHILGGRKQTKDVPHPEMDVHGNVGLPAVIYAECRKA